MSLNLCTDPLSTWSILNFFAPKSLAPHGMASGGECSSIPHSTHGTTRHVLTLFALPVHSLPLTLIPLRVSFLSALRDPGALQTAIATATPVALAILK